MDQQLSYRQAAASELVKYTSSTHTISTGAPQGCVLSPLLFSLYMNNCTSKVPSVKLLKFTDDTTLIGQRCQYKAKAVTKPRLGHWIVDAIVLAYQAQDQPFPLGVRNHSTRSVTSSLALTHGALIAVICRAAGWVAPNMFARFYNLHVEPVSSHVNLLI